MAVELLTQNRLASVIGKTRLERLVRAGWLTPVERTPARILFRANDAHAALSRMERERCPPDRIKVALVRASEKRNGRAYQKVRPTLDLDAINIDFNAFKL